VSRYPIKEETMDFFRSEIRRTLDRPRQRRACENFKEIHKLRSAHRHVPSITVAGLSPEQRVRYDELLARYLTAARNRGRKTHRGSAAWLSCVMNALRYATHTPDQLEASMAKTRRGTGLYYRRMRIYYGVMRQKFKAKQEQAREQSGEPEKLRVKWNPI
jgi:hypothetical protein